MKTGGEAVGRRGVRLDPSRPSKCDWYYPFDGFAKTVTIKLEATLEERLRQRAASTGRSTSAVIRDALQLYLSQPEPAEQRSAFALGKDLFGRHQGPADLAESRRQLAAHVWAERHARRGH